MAFFSISFQVKNDSKRNTSRNKNEVEQRNNKESDSKTYLKTKGKHDDHLIKKGN